MKAHVACLVSLVVFACAASGETNLTAWTTDAGCLRLKEAPDILYNSAAQGQPISVVQAWGTVLYQGFLGGAVLMPDLDTDGDGVNDETDSDNDGDGLSDLAELAGSAFWPITPTEVNETDSDGDGASDADESTSLTNPLDANSLLRITGIQASGGVVTVRWMARAGAYYELEGDTDLVNNPPMTGLAGTHAPSGGTPPWYEVEASIWLPIPVAPHTAYRVKK